MTTISLQPPSFKRYRRLFFNAKGISILRCLEYERLSRLSLTGRVLDFGGGRYTNYANEINNWGDAQQGYVYESANIDPKVEPTYLLNENGEIPVTHNYFDSVISFNTFEHVYKLQSCFSEIARVLKTDGQLTFIVPFIFRVHGHPHDYIRCTPSFWKNFLTEQGFKNINIEAMNWGPFSTGLTVSGIPGPFKTLRLHMALLLDLLYFSKHSNGGKILDVQQDDFISNAPIAYFIEAKKL